MKTRTAAETEKDGPPMKVRREEPGLYIPPGKCLPRANVQARVKLRQNTKPIMPPRYQVTALDWLPFSDPQWLHEVAKLKPSLQLEQVCRRSEQFLDFVRSVQDCSDILKMGGFIKILSQLSSIKEPVKVTNRVNRIVFEVLSSARENGAFCSGLATILSQMPQEGSSIKRNTFVSFLNDLHFLFKQLLRTFQSSSMHLPIDVFSGSVKQLANQEICFRELNEKAIQLVEERDKIRDRLYQLASDAYQNKQISNNTALPTPEELKETTLPLDLVKNVVKGDYRSTHEYLVVQYHLLREDFIHPLRCALHKIQEENEDCHDVKIYENVRFNHGSVLLSEGIAFKISFEFPGCKNVNWKFSKRLTFGSLLCLSEDNFSDVIFATVAERDTEELSRGRVTIKLENGLDSSLVYPRPTAVYQMIDTPGYYAAYAPVLKRLHNMNMKPHLLPFSNYLVSCSTQIQLPLYLRCKQEDLNGDTRVLMDLEGITNDGSVTPPHLRPPCGTNILDETAWDELQAPLLDSSQKRALHAALTRELAIIQGPPGTGKTYIGLKVVETLLRNRQVWSTQEKTPIVVVCYTNHALDQFLEGVINMNFLIRRIGGRCKSEKVERYNVRSDVNRRCRMLGIYCSSQLSIQKLSQRIVALGEFLDGKFNLENCRLYCTFLANQVIGELEYCCNIVKLSALNGNSTSLAAWLSQDFGDRIYEYLQNPTCYERDFYLPCKAIEDERRILADEEDESESYVILRMLGRDAIEKFVRIFGTVEPLSIRRACCISADEIHQVEPFIRLQLFKHFLRDLKEGLQTELQRRERCQAHYEKERELIMVQYLRQADVIGLTTTGAAKYNSVLSQVAAKIVIIEEAAEVLEAHALSTLTQHTQHLILIGDHRQLRPKPNSYILARNYHLDVSLFERLVTNDLPCVTLEVQHRMRPEISEIVSSKIYGGSLKDADSTKVYPHIKGMKHNLYFVDHDQPETLESDLQSPTNYHEATFLARLCSYLLQQGYRPEEITTLTPYTGQMFMLRKAFNEAGIGNVCITPVDSYQGEENEIILLSLVRSNAANKAGFVRDDNRVCVALSRAKQGLFCIGNFSLFQKCSKLWESIISDLKAKQLISLSLPLQCTRHKRITEVSTSSDFDCIPDGGCTEKCKCRLGCNHVCPSFCHPDETRHTNPCMEPCPKRCQADLHRCKLLCHDECGKCKELVEKMIPSCKHKQQVPCYKDPSEFVCQEECLKDLPCGHRCKRKCGEICTRECQMLIECDWPCGHRGQAECYITKEKYTKLLRKCKHPCGKILECGHCCKGECGQCRQGRLHSPCQERCDRPLLCGHLCPANCAVNCPPCDKECPFTCPHAPCGHKCSAPCKECPHACEWICPHYKCTQLCGEMCDRPTCNEPCPLLLKCSHKCVGLCGEICPKVCRVCNKENFNELVPIMFGTEEPDDEQTRFIQLVDCEHIFEVESLDKWMEREETKVQWPTCPICMTPVFMTLRYAKIAKKTRQDMNEIKKKEFYALDGDKRELLKQELGRMASNSPLITRERDFYLTSLEYLNDYRLQNEYLVLSAAEKMQKASPEALMGKSLYTDQGTTERLNCLKKKSTTLCYQAKDFIEWLKIRRRKQWLTLTDQMRTDILAEQRRILLLVKVYVIQTKTIKKGLTMSQGDQQILEDLLQKFEANGQQVEKMTDTAYNFKSYELKALTERNPGIEGPSFQEKQMIIKALQAKPGSWYKCTNGHIYQIGQCGGATEEGLCPECGATIGGQSHRLRTDNFHAPEMDGSQRDAWSTAVDIANYDPDELRRIANL